MSLPGLPEQSIQVDRHVQKVIQSKDQFNCAQSLSGRAPLSPDTLKALSLKEGIYLPSCKPGIAAPSPSEVQ